jgi:hypothetical protein
MWGMAEKRVGGEVDRQVKFLIARTLGSLSLLLADSPAATEAMDAAGSSPLTSNAAKRAGPRNLERMIGAVVGHELRLVTVKHYGFSFEATMRMPARADGQFCTAPQLTVRFEPDPSRAPAGAKPGAVHVSDLPMTRGRTSAAQVFRSGPPALKTWFRPMGPDPCESVDVELPFLIAKSADVAERGLAAFEAATLAAREGSSLVPIDCGGEGSSCRKEIADLAADGVQEISDRCYLPEMSAAQRSRCFRVELRTEQVNDHSHSYRFLLIIMKDDVNARSKGIEAIRFIRGYAFA